jgi:hypothetical protein
MEENRKHDLDSRQEDRNGLRKPDPETLHRTDPQEHMEGPVSSPMHKTGKAFDTDETKEHANRKMDKNL